jgi:ABC-type antimicrobial peptide transport system permease subunit
MATATERDLLAREEAPLGWFGRGLRFQGWSMLAIAAIGLLAVMRIWVRSAYPEFGMRRAVGARHRHIAMLVLLEAIAVALGGLGLGLWFGPSLWSSLPDLVQGLTPWDPGAVAPYAIALVAVTLLGAAEPLWAASRTTPHALLGSTGE